MGLHFGLTDKCDEGKGSNPKILTCTVLKVKVKNKVVKFNGRIVYMDLHFHHTDSGISILGSV